MELIQRRLSLSGMKPPLGYGARFADSKDGDELASSKHFDCTVV
jgi:hypothetical protein